MKYKIRFVTLDPNTIFNQCGPTYGSPLQWDEAGLLERKEYANQYIEKVNKRNGFFDRLEASILAEGIKNPILVNAGFAPVQALYWLPPEMQSDTKKMLLTYTSGGSRLWIATKHNMEVPCIVSDFIDRFSDAPEIKTEEEMGTYYKDDPTRIVFGKERITVKFDRW